MWHERQFQFGLMFSDKIKGTLEYEMIGPALREGEVDIRTVWPDMSKTLEATIQEDEGLPDLINKSGRLLSSVVWSTKREVARQSCSLLAHFFPSLVESLMLDQQEMALEQSSFSQVHHQEWKSMIHVQYCKTAIVSDIILYTWGSLDSTDRQYLLKKWAD